MFGVQWSSVEGHLYWPMPAFVGSLLAPTSSSQELHLQSNNIKDFRCAQAQPKLEVCTVSDSARPMGHGLGQPPAPLPLKPPQPWTLRTLDGSEPLGFGQVKPPTRSLCPIGITRKFPGLNLRLTDCCSLNDDCASRQSLADQESAVCLGVCCGLVADLLAPPLCLSRCCVWRATRLRGIPITASWLFWGLACTCNESILQVCTYVGAGPDREGQKRREKIRKGQSQRVWRVGGF